MILRDWQKIVQQLKDLEVLSDKRQRTFNELTKSIVWEILRENRDLRNQLKLLEVKT